jgi:hypothetical protein
MKKIASRRVDIAGAHSWFKRAGSLPDVVPLDTSMHSEGNMWDFIKALVNLTLPSKSSEIVPHTFLFDEERIIKLRSDMQDLINLEICMYLHRSLEASSRTQEMRYAAADDTPNESFASSPCDRPASPADEPVLSSPTIPLPHHFGASKPKNIMANERGHFIRTLSGRQVWVPKVEDGHASTASSPRSSPSSTASTPEYPPTPLYLSLLFTDTASQVRSSLLAILSSSTSTHKWATLASSLALQILRSTTTPLTHLPQFESHLAFHLSNPRSRIYQEAESRILSQLFPVLQKLVKSYTPLTSLRIFEAATSPAKPLRVAPSANSGSKEEILEITTRIAHIGILHWRVWAPLAYLVDPDAEEESEVQPSRATSMP